MTRYAAGQVLLACVLAAVGAVKAARILLDGVDDALSTLSTLSGLS